jgi:hypothetical protein
LGMKILYSVMKTNIILPAFILSATTLYSQSGTTGVAMGQEFAELAAHGGLNGKGFAAFQSYKSDMVKGSQFFLPDWSKGEVVTIRNEIYYESLQFIYDKVRQELFVRQKDSALILLTNKDEIKSFSLRNDQNEQFNFINSKFYTEERPEVFYQILVYDSAGLSLFKHIKTTLEKADTRDMLKVKEGDINDAFVDKNTYYLLKPKGALTTVQLKTKSLKKSFEELGINIEQYLKNHPQGIPDEEYLVEMVRQLNR